MPEPVALSDLREPFDEEDYPLQSLTHRTIGAFLAVHAALGYGFVEAAYRRALRVELAYHGTESRMEVPFELVHRGVVVGVYRADLIVASKLIVEVKAGLILDPIAPVQLLNYLKVSGLPLGLILHAGPRPAIKRIVASRGRMETIR